MDKNILFIGKPLVCNTQDYAFPSAAMADDTDFINWIFSNTIQLYYSKDKNNIPLTYFYNGLSHNPLSNIPLLQRQYIKADILEKCKTDIINFIIIMINEGYYFTTSVNEWYLSSRPSYQARNFNHGIMIYGYDKIREVLYTSGYDKTFHFTQNEIRFKDFIQAFYNTDINNTCHVFKRNHSKYELDIKLIRKLIVDYITNKNTSEDLRILQNPLNNYYWGSDACLQITNIETELDYRDFYTIYEHKLIMERRLNKINESLQSKEIANISSQYKILGNSFYNLLMMSIKYNKTLNKLILDKIEEKLKILIDDDIKLLNDLLHYI